MVFWDEYFEHVNPGNGLLDNVAKVKSVLSKIPLPVLSEKHLKLILSCEMPFFKSEYEEMIWKLNQIDANLHRIWKKKKDKKVLYGIFYRSKFEDLNREINRFSSNGYVINFELKLLFDNYKPEIFRLLTQYEDLFLPPVTDPLADILESMRDGGD